MKEERYYEVVISQIVDDVLEEYATKVKAATAVEAMKKAKNAAYVDTHGMATSIKAQILYVYGA